MFETNGEDMSTNHQTMSDELNEVGSEDFTSRPVPPDQRMPKFSLMMAYWACCSAMFWIYVSALLAGFYGTKHTLFGLFVSSIVYSIINGIITKYAIRTGSSVSLFSRVLFGRSGSALATLIFSATAIYYAVFEGSVIAVASTYLWPNIEYWIAALVIVLYSVPLILGSVQQWLDKFNGVLLPFYLAGLLICVGVSIAEYGYSNDWLNAPGAAPAANGWWKVFVVFMGVWILMMFTFDYARFGDKKDADFHAKVSFGMPFYLLTFIGSGLVGIFLVNTIPMEGGVSEASAVKAIITLLGFIGLVFVWITQTRINTANYYLATVNFESLVRLVTKVKLSKLMAGIIIGVIVFTLMLSNVFSWLLTALAYQGVFVVAWVGVAMSHILGVGKSDTYESSNLPDSAYPTYHVPGLSSWLIAVVIGVIMMNIPSLADYSAVATAILAFIIYRVWRG